MRWQLLSEASVRWIQLYVVAQMWRGVACVDKDKEECALRLVLS